MVLLFMGIAFVFKKLGHCPMIDFLCYYFMRNEIRDQLIDV